MNYLQMSWFSVLVDWARLKGSSTNTHLYNKQKNIHLTKNRALLGSVSDYCSHNCHCTIVIVKAHPDHPEGKHEMKSVYKRHEE